MTNALRRSQPFRRVRALFGAPVAGPPDDQAGLEIDSVRVGYGRLEVLHALSLRIAPGEAVAVLGANGAGKTTLLKTISGVLRPTEGTIRFRGQDIRGRPPHELVRMGIAHVPEGREIFVRQTVEDNLRLALLVRRDKTGARDDVERVLDLFPALREKLRQRAEELSGGQQQMLAIARALLTRPRLLLLDEPSLGLAPTLMEEVASRLRDIRADGSMSILIVEQNVAMAIQLTDRTYVMRTGEFVSERPSAELWGRQDLIAAYLGPTEG